MPGMSRKVLAVGVLYRVLGLIQNGYMLNARLGYLFGAHEQKMLNGVRHTRHVISIAERADINIDRSAGFVSFGIMNQ